MKIRAGCCNNHECMILDYCFNSRTRNFEISYTDSAGYKKIMFWKFPKDDSGNLLFPKYVPKPDGEFVNWDGRRCARVNVPFEKYSFKMLRSPSKWVLKQIIKELPEHDRKTILEKNFPNMYAFDIETGTSDDTFPDPEEACFPVYTISVCDHNLNTVVFGWKKAEINAETLQERYTEYLKSCPFYAEKIHNELPREPVIKYLCFASEKEMLKKFLQTVVANAPVLTGWNTYGFDWPYLMNRVSKYYPDLLTRGYSMRPELSIMSITGNTCTKKIESANLTKYNKNDSLKNATRLPYPCHTVLIDHLDVVKNYDMSGIIEKESMALDYVARSAVGLGKVNYRGNLERLYNTDYETYLFYNSIDSALVQLIEKRLRTMDILCAQAVYCEERLINAFGKIAFCEALVFNWFWNHGYRVIDDFKLGEKVSFKGAYVKDPSPGVHKWICCNDFASLYPSAICSAGARGVGGISFENYVGSDHARDSRHLLTAEEIEKYRNDSSYFVTVDNAVFKNDKEYCLKSLQLSLKAERAANKYLVQEMNALVIADLEKIMAWRGDLKDTSYPVEVTGALGELFPETKICSTRDLLTHLKKSCKDNRCSREAIIAQADDIKSVISDNISYRNAMQTGVKLLMNSIYGGSSHPAFSWYNIDIAQAITAEGRAVIHKMERHIPEMFNKNWGKLHDLHAGLGISVDQQKCEEIINSGKNLVEVIYGDTDSLYLSYKNLISTIAGYANMPDKEILDILIGINTKYLNKYNYDFLKEWYAGRNGDSIHEFELETIAYSGIWTDSKKKYVQILLWKDGRIFNDYQWKSKGFETSKPSHPRAARKILKNLLLYLLTDLMDDAYSLQKLNIKVQEARANWKTLPFEDLCENVSVNAYSKYIDEERTDEFGNFTVKTGCPYNVRAAMNLNFLIKCHKLKGEPIKTGKVRLYNYIGRRSSDINYIAFEAGSEPDMLRTICPPAYNYMFNKYVINPLNRLITACDIGVLRSDGAIELKLFNDI